MTILASAVTNVPVVPLLGYGDYKDTVRVEEGDSGVVSVVLHATVAI